MENEALKDRICEQCKQYQRCYVQWLPQSFRYIGTGYCKNTFESRHGNDKAYKKCFKEKK
ncbi:hypothetical protein FC961_14665 [Clostridium botulinum]|nr:hypothetical protein [Clostridium botulinum]NFO92499.1 hypothetical protein [Clostridium botulinum]